MSYVLQWGVDSKDGGDASVGWDFAVTFTSLRRLLSISASKSSFVKVSAEDAQLVLVAIASVSPSTHKDAVLRSVLGEFESFDMSQGSDTSGFIDGETKERGLN
jgi:hypothetical protein